MSVAFGAPIGGVLFSLEEVSTYFPPKTMWRAFFCAIVAALTLQAIDPLQSGKLVQFQISYDSTWQWFEMFPFMLLGCAGGLIGTLFIRLNMRLARYRKSSSLGQHPYLEVLVLAFITCLISYNTPFLRGSRVGVLAVCF